MLRPNLNKKLTLNFFVVFVIQVVLPNSVFSFMPQAEHGHRGITREGLERSTSDPNSAYVKGFSSKAQEIIIDSNAWVDNMAIGEFFNPVAHCDNELLRECSFRLIRKKEKIIENLTVGTKNINQAWTDLGHALHTLQDFYSHSNWVNERGLAHNNINSDLGENVLSRLEDTQETCIDEGILSKSGREEITTGYYALGFLYGSVKQGKCAHGPFVACFPLVGCLGDEEGIHKDRPERKFFLEARVLAVEATSVFVKNILDEIKKRGNISDINAFLDTQVTP